jgi:hypothetical protein
MNKRGQVTVFIIVGVLILAVFVSFFLLRENYITEELKVEDTEVNTASVKIFVDDCLSKVSKEALVFTSLQGGYFNLQDNYSDQVFVKVPYYFDLGQENFPEKEFIEKEMADYVLDKLPDCINNFESFSNHGYLIEQGEKTVNVSLGKNSMFDLNYPLYVSKRESPINNEIVGNLINDNYGEDLVKELNNFNHKTNLNFEKVYNLIKETVIKHQLNPDYVPVGHISLSAYENDYKFKLNYPEDNIVIYSFIFDDYKINFGNYTFLFAGRYNWSDLKSKSGFTLPIEDRTCYVGDACSYNLNIYNEELFFEDYTELFDVSNDGFFLFVPDNIDVGKHNIAVKVSDKSGNEEYISFSLEVVSLLESNVEVVENE